MKLSKLPRWAQEHIENLQRERDVAVQTLKQFEDSQTPSAIFYEDAVCDGEKSGPTFRRKYIQNHAVQIEAHGISLRVSTEHGDTRGESITLQWGKSNNMAGDVAFQPLSYQYAKLITKDKMR